MGELQKQGWYKIIKSYCTDGLVKFSNTLVKTLLHSSWILEIGDFNANQDFQLKSSSKPHLTE